MANAVKGFAQQVFTDKWQLPLHFLLILDDTITGPRPKNGLSKLRKHNTFNFRPSSGNDTNHNLQIQCFPRRTVFRQPPSRTFYCNLVFVKHSGEERDSYRWDGRKSICTEKGFDKPTMFWIQREIVKENPCFVNHFLSFTFLSHTCNEIFF